MSDLLTRNYLYNLRERLKEIYMLNNKRSKVKGISKEKVPRLDCEINNRLAKEVDEIGKILDLKDHNWWIPK